MEFALMRHCKSDWPSGIADHDRSLTGQGAGDAAVMAQWLLARWRPNVIVTSSARRAQETAHAFGEVLDLQPIVDDSLYGAGEAILADAVERHGSGALLVGHNPTLADAAHTWSGGLESAMTGEVFPPGTVAVLAGHPPKCRVLHLGLPGDLAQD